jgi:hypothetical protein
MKSWIVCPANVLLSFLKHLPITKDEIIVREKELKTSKLENGTAEAWI